MNNFIHVNMPLPLSGSKGETISHDSLQPLPFKTFMPRMLIYGGNSKAKHVYYLVCCTSVRNISLRQGFLLYLRSPKGGCCSISDDLYCSCICATKVFHVLMFTLIRTWHPIYVVATSISYLTMTLDHCW